MALSVGIVGLPNVGKSTVFNALTAGKAEAANYPFCTIDPNVGVVPVPDERLKRIEAKIKTQKVIPAIVEIVDIAGLVKGASQGEGLGNKFLANIRETNAVLMMVRCFDEHGFAGFKLHVDWNGVPYDADVYTPDVVSTLEVLGGTNKGPNWCDTVSSFFTTRISPSTNVISEGISRMGMPWLTCSAVP